MNFKNIAFALLIVLNLAMLGLLWRQGLQKDGPPRGPGGRAVIERFLQKELGFSQEQMQRFHALAEQRDQQVRPLRREIHEFRDQLFAQIKNDAADPSEAERLQREIGQREAQLEQVNFAHFRQLRELCDLQQRPVFDQLIEEVLRKAAPGPPERRSPPRR